MIDRDLTELYGVETRVLNQGVKRNIERFPDDFRFELSREECLRSQIVISNGRGGNRYSTYAFTEQGVAMSRVWQSKLKFLWKRGCGAILKGITAELSGGATLPNSIRR